MAYPPVAQNVPIAALIADLDALVSQAMDEWRIPGLAIAVVQNGEVSLLKTYGYRDVEAGLPVTTGTLFTICSITKSFTATGLALLVDERRLDWAKPVREYIPEFRLHDAGATDRITVRDLLCHHSGLPSHDWIWMPGDLSRAQMLAAMRHLEPSGDLRNAYQYNNLGYVVAGVVAERISGLSWEEFTSTHLTEKLDMTVRFTQEDLMAAADGAVPYAMDGDTRLRTEFWPIRPTSAGGINASIAGIANWLRLHLDKGEFEGQRLLSPDLVREMQTPRVHVSPSEFSEIGDLHYGLGFRSYSYRGERAVGHSGGWIGWGTLMTMLPERGIGVAVFTNRDPSDVTDILTNFIFDRLCGKEPVPWFDRFRERRRKFLAQLEVDRQTRKGVRKTGTRSSHDLADYTGDYEHAGYGRIAIAQAGDSLHWAYRGLSAPLTHWHYDTFELPQAPGRLLRDGLTITFSMDREGNITSLAAPFEPMVKDIDFMRVPTGDCLDPGFRKACTGIFSHGPITHVVALDANGQLTLAPGNQPTYKLRPYQGGIFTIIGLEGFRVEFRRASDDTMAELILHQPNGTFMARRGGAAG